MAGPARRSERHGELRKDARNHLESTCKHDQLADFDSNASREPLFGISNLATHSQCTKMVQDSPREVGELLHTLDL